MRIRFQLVMSMLSAAAIPIAVRAEQPRLLADDAQGDEVLHEYAAEIFQYFPLAAACIAVSVCILAHWLASRSAGLSWDGGQISGVSLWVGPLLAAVFTYGLCAGGLVAVYASDETTDFKRIFRDYIGPTELVLWVAGLLLSVVPGVRLFFRPATTR